MTARGALAMNRRAIVKSGACALVGLGSVPSFLVRAAGATASASRNAATARSTSIQTS